MNLASYEDSLEYLKVDVHVCDAIRDFYKNRKYIGAGQQSTLLLAEILGTKNKGPGLVLTTGPSADKATKE